MSKIVIQKRIVFTKSSDFFIHVLLHDTVLKRSAKSSVATGEAKNN